MGLIGFFKKEKKLGVAQTGARYDLPLTNDPSSRFLVLLVSLMSFLSMLALAGSFALSGVTQKWSAGLQNSMTIEIPAQMPKSDSLRSAKEIEKLAHQVADLLDKNATLSSSIESHETLSNDAIKDLVSPWLGEDIVARDLPLPGLISVDVKPKSNTAKFQETLSKKLHAIAKDIRLDTHDSWLGDILKLTGILQMASAFIALTIGGTTIIAVAGAIRAKMAVHEKEVRLLHLMGARDHYIAKQFQRHAFTLALKGAIIGVIIAMIALYGLSAALSHSESNLMPKADLQLMHYGLILMIPILGCVIASFTARFTVLRALCKMP